ncbi:MAG: translation initiation factor IF-2 [Candidatus Eisenbacteria bacterium]|uniref:Translation initiation factor IF-2 n=1 Tax=Eiseniibacteriota bacterium TaxID=2212470 RepID=A0A7Y2E4X7_UNCEI|nr:translation initiation factor IF-2 [Candidatus Eisenbacteria bacterium]
MTDKKPRVYQVAKDFNVSSEALLEILKGLGVKARSHMSTVDPSAIELIQKKFNEEKEEVVAEAPTPEPEAPTQPEPTPTAPIEVGPPSMPYSKPVTPPPVTPPPPATPKQPSAPAQSRRVNPPRSNAPSTGGAQRPGMSNAGPRPTGGRTGGGRPHGKGGAFGRSQPGQNRRRRKVPDARTVADSVKRTLADIDGGGKSKKYKKKQQLEAGGNVATEEQMNTISVTEFITVVALAEHLDVSVAQIITKLMGMGKMVTQNQRLDKETIELVALEFEHVVEFQAEHGAEEIEEGPDDPEKMVPRPPVVTVMGHVDHGKTSLLDYIRKANVVAGEKGGITQHIGAYEVQLDNGREVTFLDTPGHQAFTAMRARGAQATDIVVLVVAADDRVMPQTIEAIDHAKAAEVPMIVAINKVDKPDANPALVKQDLANRNLLVEEYGGTVSSVDISAKTGAGIDDLMELILLQADLLEIKADPERLARGTVIESKVEQGRGTVATVLVQTGTLEVGSPFVCGDQFGKVRSMSDERGHRVKAAGPSTPVEVTGWSGTPAAGELFLATKTEGDARRIGHERKQLSVERGRRQTKITLLNLKEAIDQGKVKELGLIIKADVAGSAEVLSEQLGEIAHEEVRCRVIHSGVGQINENDVLLAAASNAVIIGFNVKADPRATTAAAREEVDIKLYTIIYQAVEDVRSALEGLLKPEQVERKKSTIEVRQVFGISKLGIIAGSYVKDGTVERSHRARLLRDGEEIFDGKISSLKRFKDDVKEVAAGFECGVGLEDTSDIKEGDIIETYIIEEVARRLGDS